MKILRGVHVDFYERGLCMFLINQMENSSHKLGRMTYLKIFIGFRRVGQSLKYSNTEGYLLTAFPTVGKIHPTFKDCLHSTFHCVPEAMLERRQVGRTW